MDTELELLRQVTKMFYSDLHYIISKQKTVDDQLGALCTTLISIIDSYHKDFNVDREIVCGVVVQLLDQYMQDQVPHRNDEIPVF